MNFKKKSLKLIVGISIGVALVGSIAYFSFHERNEIVEFLPSRDRQEMLKVFYDDWYWLFPGPDYSPEYILDNKIPGKEFYQSKYKGKLNIRVIRKEGKLAGFTTYYKKNFYEGFVQFIAVAPDFRRRGYGTKLTNYAVGELFKLGCKKVTILTKLNNPARKIYEGIGFKETGRDDEFIFYAITEKDFRGN